LKILFIAPKYTGGIGGHAARVAEKLRENGYDVELLHAPHIPVKNLKNPSFAILSTIKSLFSNKKYDIIHAFNVPSAFAMHYAKSKKKVLAVHGVYSDQIEIIHSKITSTLVNSAESKVLKWADKLTTDSKNAKITYKNKLGLDVEYLPAPLDISKFKDIPEVSKTPGQVAYVGRSSFEKGIDVLKSVESKINGKVVYCTNIPWKEAMKILKTSSLLVVPSRIESIPQVIKEAFYLKIPVVATSVGGVPELIQNNENGILVPPEDPEKLVNAINKILVDKELANKLTKSGYEYIMKNLTWDVLLPKYEKFYEDLLIS